ncbi:MAG: hypothetical protein Q9205_004612 [Flavoplaca limonia]
MSPKPFSSKNVFLAWAAQVSFVQLGARMVFAEALGIRPYFGMDKSWYTGLEGCCDFNLTAEAYLMLPVIRAPIANTSGPDVASFSIKHAVDLSLLVNLSEHQRQKFLKAAAVLELHRYNKYDVESKSTGSRDEDQEGRD